MISGGNMHTLCYRLVKELYTLILPYINKMEVLDLLPNATGELLAVLVNFPSNCKKVHIPKKSGPSMYNETYFFITAFYTGEAFLVINIPSATIHINVSIIQEDSIIVIHYKNSHISFDVCEIPAKISKLMYELVKEIAYYSGYTYKLKKRKTKWRDYCMKELKQLRELLCKRKSFPEEYLMVMPNTDPFGKTKTIKARITWYNPESDFIHYVPNDPDYEGCMDEQHIGLTELSPLEVEALQILCKMEAW